MFAKVFVSAAFVASALAQTFSVNTPASLVQCQPASISWVGGTAPFVLSVLPAGQVSAPAISFIATGLTSSPYTWTVNLAAGTNLTIRCADAQGNNVYASPLVIQSGPSNSCLNASASTSGLSTVSVSAASSASGASGASASSTMSMSSMMSSASAASSRASSSGNAASSASSLANSASSAVASLTSAAASATSKAGAFATAVAGAPAIALAAIGGVVALF